MLVIRAFRRLPPCLRVMYLLAPLLLLTGMALLVSLLIMSWPPFSRVPADATRRLSVALNLNALSLACSLVVTAYRVRFRQPHRTPYPLSSWQSQVRAFALLGALPLCGIVLALVIPPTSPAFFLVAGLTVLAPFVLGLAHSGRGSSSRPMGEPGA